MINTQRATQKARKDAGITPESFTCYENADISFIVNLASMALNFGWYSYLQGLEYASDLTWSKIMIILGMNIIGQLTGAIIATSLVI